MTEPSVHHGEFTIERNYDTAPEAVFAAWSSAEAKQQWFFGPVGKWTQLERRLDFRIGGSERVRGQITEGPVTSFGAYYHDIVANRRIVYSYDMHLDAQRISVSLATIQFKPHGKGTKLVLTEQGAFLDGYDDAGSREQGTRGLLANLDAALRR